MAQGAERSKYEQTRAGHTHGAGVGVHSGDMQGMPDGAGVQG